MDPTSVKVGDKCDATKENFTGNLDFLRQKSSKLQICVAECCQIVPS
jgi:hypothetical protein